MDKIKVEWKSRAGNHISQIYSDGLQYSFASPNNKQCCPFVFCKDFLQDCIWAQLYGKTASIFGFTFNAKTDPPISLEKCRLLVANSADAAKFRDRIEKCVLFINQIEKKLHLKRTVAFDCESPPAPYNKCGIFLIEGSSRWQEAPPLLSLYTLLLRVGFVYNGTDTYLEHINKVQSGQIPPYQRNDASYLNQAKKGIDQILELGYRRIFYIDPKKNYPEGIAVGTLHGSTGIIGLVNGSTKNVVPYWSRPNLVKPKKKKKKKVVTPPAETDIKPEVKAEVAKIIELVVEQKAEANPKLES